MKKRADLILTEKKLARSRSQAADLIKRGKVRVGEKIIKKAGALLDQEENLQIESEKNFVSRGGIKLESALKKFKIDVAGKTIADVGASTGGFTDCLLKLGTEKIYAIDVGQEQLSPALKENPKIISLEKTDIRNVILPEKVDGAVVDVSFISLSLVLPAVKNLLKENGFAIALVKPQFEVGRENLNKSGIVKNKEVAEASVIKIKEEAKKLGFKILGEMESPIKGGDGNTEFFLFLKQE